MCLKAKLQPSIDGDRPQVCRSSARRDGGHTAEPRKSSGYQFGPGFAGPAGITSTSKYDSQLEWQVQAHLSTSEHISEPSKHRSLAVLHNNQESRTLLSATSCLLARIRAQPICAPSRPRELLSCTSRSHPFLVLLLGAPSPPSVLHCWLHHLQQQSASASGQANTGSAL